MNFLLNQKLSVWAPPGDLLGEVKQTFGITSTELQIFNALNQMLYRIQLPTKFCLSKEMHFKVNFEEKTYQLHLGDIIIIH
jgi:hypothetical protein